MGQSDFIAVMAPWAKYASAQTGLDANLIMAQWGNETSWGTSYQWTTNYNPAGLGITGPEVQGQGFGSINGGVNAYIHWITDGGANNRYYKVIHAGDATAQAVALGNSGWAAGQYNAGSGPGSSLLQIMSGLGTSVNNAEAMTAATGATSSTATAATGATATTGGASTTAAAQTTNVTIPGSPDAGFNPMPTTMSTTTTNADALKTMQTDLQAYGFSPADAAAVTQAAWTEITNNTDPSQIVIDIQTPGSQFYPIFEKYFPGFVGANQSLQTQGLPAVSVADYQTYTKNAEQLAQAAGLPGGLINKDTIGTLIGGNVSYAELGKRVDDATSLAINSTDEQRSMFNQYFGLMDQYVTADNPFGTGANGFNAHGPLTTGQIAALVLDPKASEPLIHQQITAAQLGGTGVTAGVGAISKDEAVKLAQSGVSGTQSFSQFAPLAPLEQSLVGQTTNAAQNTLTPDQLVEGNLLGTAGDVRAQQVAQESRKAPFSGGGGDVAAASGVVGAGSASPGSKTGQ